MAAELLIVARGQVSDALSGLQKVGKEIKDTESKAGKFGKAFGAAVAGAGAAAGGLLAKGFADNLDIGAANAKLAGQLGLTAAEADKAGKVAASVYGANWGGSIEEINSSIRSIDANLADVSTTSEAELTKVTTAAQALADTFEVDVGESSKAAGQLIKNGLAGNATEAFDVITKGFQSGLDSSGDFLETLTEYAPQFEKLGLDGGGALSLLQAGLQGGARDTDVIADAFKEFSLRAIDGSKSTSDAYRGLGLDAQQTAKDIAAGGDTARDSTFKVLEALNDVKDPLKQNQLGVQLFGTQWEDTLRQILPNIAATKTGMEGVAGATDQMAEAAGGSAKGQIETLQRQFQLWTQSMAESSGATGLVVTGLATFGGSALATGAQLGQVVTGIASFSGGAKIAAAATKVWTGIQAAFNLVMAANPIGLAILAIAGLIAIIVLAYQRSETFRRIVDAAFRKVQAAAAFAWNWIKSNWPQLLAIITGPIGLAVAFVVRKKEEILGAFRAIPGAIRGIFSGAGSLLSDAGRRIVDGLVNAVTGAFRRVRDAFGRLTSLIPSWKGPKQRDLRLLAKPGDWIMTGFLDSLEDRYADIRSSLGGFTSSLGDSVDLSAGLAVGDFTAGAGQPQVVVEFADSGDPLTDAVLKTLRKAVRVRGAGNVQAALGV